MRQGISVLLLVPAALSLLYGFTVAAARSGTRFYLIWFVLAACFAALSFAVRFSWLSLLPKALRFAAACLLAAGVLLFVLCEALILSHFSDSGGANLDCIIVLGAQVRENGPSVVLAYRLDAALAYLLDNPETRCIVSGGQGVNEPCPEALVMRDYLVERGIAPSRIVAEEHSKNTVGNIRNCLPLLDPEGESIGIVTNNFHVFRGVSLARKQGIRNVTGIAAPSHPLFLPNNLLREFAGVMKDTLFGNM